MIVFPIIAIAALANVAELTPASAGEPLTVRAGEHGKFSRIVIPNAPEEWEIKAKNRIVRVTFSNSTQRLDVSAVDKNRKAHRVLTTRSETTADNDILILTLSCDCTARTERSEHNSLIIDIFDRPTDPLTKRPPTAHPSKEANASPPTPSRRNPSSNELRAARDRMIALLAAANNHGVVALKHNTGQPANLIPEQTNKSSGVTPITNAIFEASNAPALGGVDAGNHCIDQARFTDTGPGAGEIGYAEIVDLRQRLENVEGADQAALEIALGYGYLRLGFFSEAAAQASAPDKVAHSEFMLIGGLAALGRGDAETAKGRLEPFNACGGIYDLLLRAASPSAMRDKPYSNAQYRILKTLPASLRGPVAETLALKALEQENLATAKRLYDIASAAYGSEETPSLVILRAVLPNDDAQDNPLKNDRAHEKLAAIAQTPGPYRSRALGVLAEEFERKATIAYDGFFDDLAEQALISTASRGEIDAAISGARALAAAGRIGAAFEKLRSVKAIAPETAQLTGIIARSMIATALASDKPAQRLAAVDFYFEYKDLFGAEDDDHEMRLAIARALASMGAPQLAVSAVEEIPILLRADADTIIANAYLSTGDEAAALALTKKRLEHDGLAEVALRASAKLDDRGQIQKVATQLLQRQKMDARKTAFLWRAGEWHIAANSFAALPPEQFDINMATHYALAALKAGSQSLPASAKQALAANQSYAQALEHMFAAAPVFDFRNAAKIDAFITGVSWETEFFRQGMSDE